MADREDKTKSTVCTNFEMPLVKGFSLTYSMLEDHLKPFQVLYKPDTYKRKIRWFFLIPGSEKLDSYSIPEDYLCLCHDDVASVLAPENPQALFLVIASDDTIPSWVQSASGHVILIAPNGRFYTINSYIQSLFLANLVWESNLDKVVHNSGNLIDLVEPTSVITGNFICITDTGFNQMVYSRSVNPPAGPFADMIERGCYDKDTINLIEKNVLRRANDENKLIVLDPDDNFPYTRIHFPLFINNEYLFHITMICQSGRSIKASIDYFKRFMQYASSYCNDFWNSKIEVKSPWHRILLGLISGKKMKEDYIETQLEMTEIPAASQFRLLMIEFNSDQPYQKRARIAKVASELNGGFCYPFTYKGNLLVLLFSPPNDLSTLSVNKMSKDVDNILFTAFDVPSGLSQIFINITDIDRAYQQAKIALAMKHVTAYEYAMSIGKTKIPAFFFEHTLLYYIMLEDRDNDLVEFSFKNRILDELERSDQEEGTDLVQLLWVYLCNERNATETSKTIHFHRNTVLYHINKLEKKYDLDFSLPLTRNRAMLDYMHYFTAKYTNGRFGEYPLRNPLDER